MRLLFLPGASGSREFWAPVRAQLTDLGSSEVLGWPGLGGVPAHSNVTHFDALVDLVLAETRAETHVVAQSMGAVVALKAALHSCESPSEWPLSPASLTLVAIAGGVDVAQLGATDWRTGAPEWHPRDAPDYFFEERSDFSSRLHAVRCPTLLLSGGADPLSPPAVSLHVQRLIPNATHESLAGGDHDLAFLHSDWVSTRIRAHITANN